MNLMGLQRLANWGSMNRKMNLLMEFHFQGRGPVFIAENLTGGKPMMRPSVEGDEDLSRGVRPNETKSNQLGLGNSRSQFSGSGSSYSSAGSHDSATRVIKLGRGRGRGRGFVTTATEQPRVGARSSSQLADADVDGIAVSPLAVEIIVGRGRPVGGSGSSDFKLH